MHPVLTQESGDAPQDAQRLDRARRLGAAHVRGLPAELIQYGADAALGTSLSRLCFEGPADELTLTHNAQPALLVHGAAVWAVTRDVVGSKVMAAAGHSLGEFTAYHAAGSLGLEDAVRIVRRRGELMYESGVKRPGAMAAILGEPTRSIEEICEQATREAGLVVPANYNCPGQLVVSGQTNAVDECCSEAEREGARRAVRLRVSGAFHSPLVAHAADRLRPAIDKIDFKMPSAAFMSTVTAKLEEAQRYRSLLVEQLTAPVKFTQAARELIGHGVETFVEVGPGNVLSGVLRRIDSSVRAIPVNDLRYVPSNHKLFAGTFGRGIWVTKVRRAKR